MVFARNDSLAREFQMFQESLQLIASEVDKGGQYGERARRSYSSQRTYPGRSASSENRYSENRSQNYTAFPRQEKLAAGERIPLNSTDTAEWKKIPGIGSAFASRIVKYQNMLGGFASVEQLREVYGVDNEMFGSISPYVEPDGNFRKIQINKQEFKELLSHPYLNYKQVQAVMNLRKRKGNIQSMDELGMLDEFTSEDIERLRPYAEF